MSISSAAISEVAAARPNSRACGVNSRRRCLCNKEELAEGRHVDDRDNEPENESGDFVGQAQQPEEERNRSQLDADAGEQQSASPVGWPCSSRTSLSTRDAAETTTTAMYVSFANCVFALCHTNAIVSTAAVSSNPRRIHASPTTSPATAKPLASSISGTSLPPGLIRQGSKHQPNCSHGTRSNKVQRHVTLSRMLHNSGGRYKPSDCSEHNCGKTRQLESLRVVPSMPLQRRALAIRLAVRSTDPDKRDRHSSSGRRSASCA